MCLTQVQLAVLSHLCSDMQPRAPTIQLVFRDASTIQYIPNYEGQPMITTLNEQIVAAGGIVVGNINEEV
jgi:hypothetical protein